MAVVMKKIVLENFKSFEGSVEIDIAPFTSPSPTHKIEGRLCCVIGPNGSGMCIATYAFFVLSYLYFVFIIFIFFNIQENQPLPMPSCFALEKKTLVPKIFYL
jgi:hypothetical protein